MLSSVASSVPSSAVLLGAAIVCCQPAHAEQFCGLTACSTLAPAIATIQLSNTEAPVAIPGPAGSVTGPNSTGIISYGPLLPSVYAESSVFSHDSTDATANIITSYFHYQVGGASVLPFTGTLFVPVLVQGSYSLAASSANNGFGLGDAAVLVKVNYSDFVPNSFTASLASNECAAGTGGCTATGTFTLRGQLRIGVPMSVDMYAVAHSQSLVGDVGNAGSTAFIDPLITIDPSFADAANFTLYVSPGVGNTAPVPLPPALLLFGSAVLALRRRHFAAAQAP